MMTLLGMLAGLLVAMRYSPSSRWTRLVRASGMALQRGDHAGAESALRQALRAAESTPGPLRARRRTATLMPLARLLFERGRHAEAAECAAEHVECARRLSPESEQVAQGMSLLADICAARSRFGEAEALYRTSLEIEEKLLGRDSIQLTQNLIKLGRLLQTQARRGEAAVLFHRCADIQDQGLQGEA